MTKAKAKFVMPDQADDAIKIFVASLDEVDWSAFDIPDGIKEAIAKDLTSNVEPRGGQSWRTKTAAWQFNTRHSRLTSYHAGNSTPVVLKTNGTVNWTPFLERIAYTKLIRERQDQGRDNYRTNASRLEAANFDLPDNITVTPTKTADRFTIRHKRDELQGKFPLENIMAVAEKTVEYHQYVDLLQEPNPWKS